MNCNLTEDQLFDIGDGVRFAVKISLPAQASFEDFGMEQRTEPGVAGWWLRHYESGQFPPVGDYFVVVRENGSAGVLSVPGDRVSLGDLGTFGHFYKQNGVAFVVPHNSDWPTSAFGYVYKQR